MTSLRAPLNRAGNRGSALVMVVLAVFVLTIVGVGLAYFSSTEDKISGNDKLQKEGFYAAETGLRIGEKALNTAGTLANTTLITTLLTTAPTGSPGTYDSPNTIDLHDGGYPAQILSIGGVDYRDIQIKLTSEPDTKTEFRYYSLYIRNNKEDQGPGFSATSDTDKTINLIAVGYIDSYDKSNPASIPHVSTPKRITKILEEQIMSVDSGTGSGFEKGANEGGTNG